jgi:hypothetical protein
MFNAVWFVIDIVFPLARSLSDEQLKQEKKKGDAEIEECRARVAALPPHEKSLRKYSEVSEKLLEEEDNRRQSVEARLTSIMGLTSIAGTVVFSGIIAQATGKLPTQATLLKWILAIGAVYLTLQICSALLAAVSGLSRRAYPADRPRDLLPSSGVAPPSYLRSRIVELVKMVVEHRSENNEKVTQMAVAHRAMRNFLVGLLIVAFGTAYFALGDNPAEDFSKRIRENQELYLLLRGPQGPRGDPGPKGEAGPRGPIGRPCNTLQESCGKNSTSPRDAARPCVTPGAQLEQSSTC